MRLSLNIYEQKLNNICRFAEYSPQRLFLTPRAAFSNTDQVFSICTLRTRCIFRRKIPSAATVYRPSLICGWFSIAGCTESSQPIMSLLLTRPSRTLVCEKCGRIIEFTDPMLENRIIHRQPPWLQDKSAADIRDMQEMLWTSENIN